MQIFGSLITLFFNQARREGQSVTMLPDWEFSEQIVQVFT